MRLACIKNHPAEGPGAISDWAEERKVWLEVFDPGQGVDAVLSSFDGLILMGGPMSVHDASHDPGLAEVLSLVKKAVAEEFPLLGICLGAQMLAKAAGGEVVPGAQREIGWFPIRVGRDGSSPLRGWPDPSTVLHWHGEQIVAPPGSPILAWNELCPVQAFRIGERQVGLQFHLEMEGSALEGMLEAFPGELAEGGRYVSSAEEMREGLREHGGNCRRWLFALLDEWSARFPHPPPR